MTPIDRLRLEKSAADCGFEMTPLETPDGLDMRSARFPETVRVRVLDAKKFELIASDPFLFDMLGGSSAIVVGGYGELYDVLRAAAAIARTRPNRVADEYKKKTAALPKTTEAERLVLQRIGQNLFRGALLDYWQCRCCVTGLDVPELLRASHIRPWAQCESDEQRLDVFNGLLLAPHLDALFDSGLMTVKDDGAVLISSELTVKQRCCLGMPDEMIVANLRDGHRAYLAFHRNTVWRR